MVTKKDDTIKTRIIVAAIIQLAALVTLGVVIYIDSHDPTTDYNSIEMLLGGIAAAPAANEIIQHRRKGK